MHRSSREKIRMCCGHCDGSRSDGRRFGLATVPVALRRLPLTPRPWWAQTMDPQDFTVLDAEWSRA
ncbi:MAG: hypothetical protein L0K30_13345, partial [Acidipropionibacterium jensenii]|uniref:hypothetical protein n=1 Tax=Acidipropionibacterium jensenii TaxID=1749 RepID=UPI0026471DDF